MIKINSKKIAEIMGSSSNVIDADIENVSSDSRDIRNGDLFIAIKGEVFDGHDFVAEVLSKGAAAAVVERLIPDVPAIRQIVVSNSLEAYGKLGAYVRSQFKGKVIGLTGSAGKTTTKEEIKFVLSKFASVYATSGNFNNNIGVPRTLCNIDMNAEYAVIEMGMSAKGEISQLVSWVKPDIALITNVYPMHIEFFPNFKAIADAKAEIFEGLPKGGIAIINEDTNFPEVLEAHAKAQGAKVVKFGHDTHPDVEFELAQEGEHHVYNAWAALTIADVLGLDIVKAASCLKDFGALEGRGKHWKLNFAKGSYTLIDDSYSGQPEAMKLGIQTLAKMKTAGRKIVVLGKMAELGNLSQAKHIEIGKVVAMSGIDVAVGVCPEMKDMLAQLPDSIEHYYFENKDGLDDFLLNNLLQNNDTVLIKGARYSSKLYKIAESLIEKGKGDK